MNNLASREINSMKTEMAKETIRTNADIRSLLRLSARIGSDPLLVHASSGNTSLKLNGTLWIKASGKWLANAEQEEILVPVNLADCQDCLEDGRPLPACRGSSRASCLRPSIETFMHAVLPQRYVVHVHCVHTLAWAVRADAHLQLAERLSGLQWQWIPYVASGLPLARAIQLASSKRPNADIFVLGNHGLVVCGDDCDSVDSLLADVRRRLACQPRAVPTPKLRFLERIQRFSHWRLPDSETLHTFGTDVVSHRITKRGILYPCQAIFLRPTPPLLTIHHGLSDVTSQIHKLDASSPFIVLEGRGVLINQKITAAEYAVLKGLAEVVRRIETGAPLEYLKDHEVSDLLSTDGHHYRMSAERNGGNALQIV
jgi:rhamnose utilization protein RhaD (predicted bifunctional aldolase and dehydrogenase)